MAAPSSSSAAEAKRDELISKEKLLVVGKSYCPYTKRARSALADIGVTPANLDLDVLHDGEALQVRHRVRALRCRSPSLAALRSRCLHHDKQCPPLNPQAAFRSVSGLRTVPQVFVGGACVGGCDDTLAALRDGSMQQRLAACGIKVSGS